MTASDQESIRRAEQEIFAEDRRRFDELRTRLEAAAPAETCNGRFQQWTMASCDHCLWIALIPGNGRTPQDAASDITTWKATHRMPARDKCLPAAPEDLVRVEAMAAKMQLLIDANDPDPSPVTGLPDGVSAQEFVRTNWDMLIRAENIVIQAADEADYNWHPDRAWQDILRHAADRSRASKERYGALITVDRTAAHSRFSVKFSPRDLWVGLRWDRKSDGLHFYLCLIPMVAIHYRYSKAK